MPASRRPPRSSKPNLAEEPQVQAPAFRATVRLQVPEEYPNVPLIYSNVAVVSVTPNDLTIHFSYYTTPVFATPPTEGDAIREVRASPAVNVVLPPKAAETLANALLQQVKGLASVEMQSLQPPGS